MSIAWDDFTPFGALLGGVLIGLSATLLLWLHGRVLGVTGILSGAVSVMSPPDERKWRFLFLGGLLLAPLLLLQVMPDRFELGVDRSLSLTVLAGVLVGVGTRLGSGCTSGHGVCGVSRGSVRSLVATGTFVMTGMVTVAVYRALTGGV